MARKRKHRKHSAARRSRRHSNPHRRQRRHRNPGVSSSGLVKQAITAAVGLAGFAAAKKLGSIAGRYIPASIPYAPIVAEVAAAAVVVWAAEKYGGANKQAAQVGALIAGAIAVLPSMIAQPLELERVVMLPAPAASSGMSAALEAALQDGEMEEGHY